MIPAHLKVGVTSPALSVVVADKFLRLCLSALLTALVTVLLLGSGFAGASSAGISGRSTTSSYCVACHTGNNFPGYTANFTATSFTVAPSGTRTVTFSLTGTGASAGGLDVSTSGGSLSEGVAELQIMSGEVTHTGPKTASAGDVSWSFTFNAPASVGTVTLSGCGNPVNNTGDSTGDGPAVCDTQTVTINSTPTANTDTASVAKNSSSNTISPLLDDTSGTGGNDSGDSIFISAASATSGTVTRINSNTQLSYTPTASFTGAVTINYTIQDEAGATDSSTVSVTVSNTAPTADNDSYSTNEDTALNVASGSGVLVGDSDANGDSLTAVKDTNPSNGAVTLNSNGSFTYTPNANFNGSDSFTYHASDGTASSPTRTVSITVNAVNDAPVANNNSYSTNEDTTLNVVVGSGVVVNDTDVEGSALTAVLVTTTSNGSLTLNSNGSFDYVPGSNFNGSDSFTYRANDGTTNSASAATVTITVNAVNDAPSAANDAYGTPEDTPLVVAAGSGVLANDSDVDGNPLTAVKDTNPSNGAVTLNSNGSFTYTPNANFNGSDSFTYHANDGTANSTTRTVLISVNSGNDPPTAANDSYSLSEDGTLTIAAGSGALANDTDTESDPLTAVQDSSPVSGTLDFNTDGSFEYTPNADFNGSDSFTYYANDGTTNSLITATVSITVNAVNDAPVIGSSPGVTPTATEDTLYIYDVNATDIDSGSLSYALDAASLARGMAIDAVSGEITWTPTNAQSGTSYGVTVSVGDGVTTTTQNYTLAVTAVNDAPVIGTISSQTVTELSALTVTPSVTDPDDANDGTNLVWSLSGAPSGMSISNTPGTVGRITYTPGEDAADPGPPYDEVAFRDFVITVQVDDGHENGVTTATQTLNLRVNKKDADGDLDADYRDNCVSTSNPNQADNDGDGVAGGAGGTNGGDACDSDDDNDTISDVAEMANGLNPADDADGTQDLDGDGLTNAEEFATCAGAGDASCLAIGTDSVGPVITTNGDQTLVATGYYTPVEISATAVDVINGVATPVTVTANMASPFRPGSNVVVWTATDSTGNTTIENQIITVTPLATLGGTQTVGEGQTAQLEVVLNGESPGYPVIVDYTVGGTATGSGIDHNLAASGQLTISSGTSGVITLNALNNGAPEFADETVVVTLTGISSSADSAVLGDSVVGTVVIIDAQVPRQLPPAVMLWVEQSSERRNIVYLDQGTVTAEAMASDPNGGSLTYDWTPSDPALGIVGSTDTVAIDPSGLADGESYELVVRVSDPGALVTEQRLVLTAVAGTPVLGAIDSDGDGVNDDVEGTLDADGDGLLDYLDGIAAPDQQALRIDTSEEGLLQVAEVDAGLQLSAGGFATATQTGGVQIVPGDVAVTDSGYQPASGMYDFVINGLDDADRVANIVLPLPVALPESPLLRVFINGEWFTFAVGATDSYATADAVDGQCPPVGDAAWTPGLATGATCLRLTLSDGGPNDADGVVNGSIHVTGGPAVAPDDEEAAPDSDKAGTVAMLFLALLTLTGFRSRRRGK